MAFAPAVKLEAPGTVKTPVCVIAPEDVMVKFCPTVDAANEVAMPFVTLTLLAPLLLKVIAPVNELVCVNVIALLPALKLDAPGTVSAAVWVILPDEVTDKFCPIEDKPKTVAMPLVTLTLFVPLLLNEIAPVKLLV